MQKASGSLDLQMRSNSKMLNVRKTQSHLQISNRYVGGTEASISKLVHHYFDAFDAINTEEQRTGAQERRSV